DLNKGDVVHAALRGQMADPARDKEGLRVYWLADKQAVDVGVSAADVKERWRKEEQAWGVGSGRPLPLKVAGGRRQKRLYARIFDLNGNEFRATAAVAVEQLPEGVDPEKLGGKGRRMWGVVEQAPGNERRYTVVGPLLEQDPDPAAVAAPVPAPE